MAYLQTTYISGSLNVSSSNLPTGSTLVAIDGWSGRLFNVNDTMDGVLFSVNNISGLPILEVSSDNSVNLGKYGGEAVKVSTGGMDVALGSGSVMFVTSSGKVGIGITSPNSKLSISSGDNKDTGPIINLCGIAANQIESGRIRFTETDIGQTPYYQGGFIHYDGLSNVLNVGVHNEADSLTSSDINAISIPRATGLIGIGTTNPQTELHIAKGTPRLRIEATTADQLQSIQFYNSGSATWQISVRPFDNSNLYFAPNISTIVGGDLAAAAKLTLTASGSVGIGTTAPVSKLHVQNGVITAGSQSVVLIGRHSSTYPESDTSHGYFQIRTNNTNVSSGGMTVYNLYNGIYTASLAVLESGYVAIGTGSARARLDVNGDIWTDWKDTFIGTVYASGTAYRLGIKTVSNTRDTQIWAQSGDTTGVSGITFYTGITPTEKVRIDNSGRMGIGVTSPSSSLVVKRGVDNVNAGNHHTNWYLGRAGIPISASILLCVPCNNATASNKSSCLNGVLSLNRGDEVSSVRSQQFFVNFATAYDSSSYLACVTPFSYYGFNNGYPNVIRFLYDGVYYLGLEFNSISTQWIADAYITFTGNYENNYNSQMPTVLPILSASNIVTVKNYVGYGDAIFISGSNWNYNVGISTTTPSLGKLQVNGNVYATSYTGSIAANNIIGTVTSASYAPWEPAASSSIVIQLSGKQPNLITGSTYPITSSWSTNVVNPNPGTGTNNYLPKWSSNQLTATSSIYDNGVSVGVNTTTPAATLHANISSSNLNEIVGMFSKQYGQNYGSTILRVARHNTCYSTGSAPDQSDQTTQYTDIEHNSLGSEPFRFGSTYGDSLIVNGWASNSGRYGNINFVTSGSIRMTVAGGTYAGRVGIGTTTPSTTLHLYSTTSSVAYPLTVATDAGYIQIGSANSYYAHFYTDRNYFYFGKGMMIEGTAYPYLNKTYDLGGPVNYWNGGYINSITSSVVYASSAIGVGTYLPSASLDVNGISHFRGGFRLPYDYTYYGVVTYYPKDAYFYSNLPNQTGSIKIVLPHSASLTMLQMKVRFYNYTGDGSGEVIISGYPYAPNLSWYGTSAVITGKTPPFSNVRFAYSASQACILFGPSSSIWQYPKVVVESVMAGYYGVANYDWTQGWSVSLTTNESGSSVSQTYATITTVLGNRGTDGYFPRWTSGVLTETSNLYQDGGNDIGIGNTSPLTPLHVYGAIRSSRTTDPLNQYIDMDGGDANGTFLNSYSPKTNKKAIWIQNLYTDVVGDASGNNDIIFRTGISSGPTERVRVVDATGNVGIGTASPGAKVEIFKDIDTSSENGYALSLLASAAGTKLIMGASNSGSGYSVIQSLSSSYSYSVRPLALMPWGGSVGIGTTAPQTKFQVITGGSSVVCSYTTLSSSHNDFYNWSYGGLTLADPTNDTYRWFHLALGGTGRYAANAQVGVIGFHQLNTNVALSQSVGAAMRALSDDNNVTNKGMHLAFYTRNSSTGDATTIVERLRITNAGDVGIGTSTPSSKLHVNNGIIIAGSSSIVLTGRYSSTYPNSSATQGYFELRTNNTDVASGGMTLLTLKNGIYTASLNVHDTGDVSIGSSSVENSAGWSRVMGCYHPSMYRSYVATSTIRSIHAVHNSGYYTSGIAGAFVGAETNHPLQFITNGAVRMQIAAAGNVGIGAAADASYKLNVVGDSKLDGELYVGFTLDTSTTSGGRVFYGWGKITTSAGVKYIQLYN